MVFLLRAERCVCRTCRGGSPAAKGRMGGSKCMCGCHVLTGQDKESFISEKEHMRGILSKQLSSRTSKLNRRS